jgi:hypothetical protein
MAMRRSSLLVLMPARSSVAIVELQTLAEGILSVDDAREIRYDWGYRGSISRG